MPRREDIQRPPPRRSEEESTVESRLTEQPNPRTAQLETAATDRIVELLFAEDRSVPEAVARESAAVVRLVDLVFERMSRGGRLIYVGAGTSGRLGVLDAAECPPTFGTPPDLVIGVMAGGMEALVRSREGVEDDRAAGAASMREVSVDSKDFVLGIATSGTTPFVHAALEEALANGAGTGFLSCTPPPVSIAERVDVCVTPLTGPEAITGSTRLKAGTATKLVLNAVTTAVMVRRGKVYGNLMVDVQARSRKLADRSLRILAEITGVDHDEGADLLARSGGSVKTAIVMYRQGVDRNLAERRLDAVGGFLGVALERFDRTPQRFYDIYSRDGEPSDRLLYRLSTGPVRVRAAAEARARTADTIDGGRHPWSPERHVKHLLACELGMIQPRLSAMAEAVAGDRTGYVDWIEGDAPEPVASLDELLEDLTIARRRTVEFVREAGDSLLARGARLGDENLDAWQFLRAMTQHDDAHAVRIAEWIHPSLIRGRSA